MLTELCLQLKTSLQTAMQNPIWGSTFQQPISQSKQGRVSFPWSNRSTICVLDHLTNASQYHRDLYLQNKSRYLCDRSSLTSRLLQSNHTRPGISRQSRNSTLRPLDLTFCHLRAMSPVHLVYLKNMGVESSMSIAVTVYGKLWGLICW